MTEHLGDLLHDPALPPVVHSIPPEVLSADLQKVVQFGEFREIVGESALCVETLKSDKIPGYEHTVTYTPIGRLLQRVDHVDPETHLLTGEWHFRVYDGERTYEYGDPYRPVVREDELELDDPTIIEKAGEPNTSAATTEAI